MFYITKSVRAALEKSQKLIKVTYYTYGHLCKTLENMNEPFFEIYA